MGSGKNNNWQSVNNKCQLGIYVTAYNFVAALLLIMYSTVYMAKNGYLKLA